MDSSLFIYIGRKDEEAFEGLGIGFTTNSQNKEGVSASIYNAENTESRDLAQKLSVRLNKPVFLSCNESVDRITKPSVEQRLVDEILEFPEYF